MTPLSLDLRTRVVAAYEADEGSYQKLADRFSISKAAVGKLVRLKRSTGSLEHQMHRCGSKRSLTSEQEVALLKHLQDHPDATLLERRDALGLHCTEKTMWVSGRRLGWRYKKSRSALPNKTVPTSLKPE